MRTSAEIAPPSWGEGIARGGSGQPAAAPGIGPLPVAAMTPTRLARSLLTATATDDGALAADLLWHAVVELGERSTWDFVDHLAWLAAVMVGLIDEMAPGAGPIALAAVCRRAAVMEAESEFTGEGWS